MSIASPGLRIMYPHIRCWSYPRLPHLATTYEDRAWREQSLPAVGNFICVLVLPTGRAVDHALAFPNALQFDAAVASEMFTVFLDTMHGQATSFCVSSSRRRQTNGQISSVFVMRYSRATVEIDDNNGALRALKDYFPITMGFSSAAESAR